LTFDVQYIDSMNEYTTNHGFSSRIKRVPIQERSFLIENTVGINGYRVNRDALRARFGEGGYESHETAHFLLLTRAEVPRTVVVHWFAPEAMDANVGDYIIKELKPLGILKETQDFSDVFGAVVGSLFPYDIERAWYVYGMNTLGRYLGILREKVYVGDQDLATTRALPATHYHPRHYISYGPHPYGTFNREDREVAVSTIGIFAILYSRAYELLAGERFLDAGCSFGFLPLLVAERFPELVQVVGVDIRAEPFTTVRRIAQERGLRNVQYVQADLHSDDLGTIGNFDTVAALHLMEHFTEEDMYRVLGKLLKITERRLIVAVPYEEGEPEALYGHKQLFSRARLEEVGRWCLERWEGVGRMWCEECEGGLLVVERNTD
jgi:SAM-dependent methyltransferase